MGLSVVFDSHRGGVSVGSGVSELQVQYGVAAVASSILFLKNSRKIRLIRYAMYSVRF